MAWISLRQQMLSRYALWHKKRFVRWLGKVSNTTMQEITKALAIVLGIEL